MTDIFFFVRVQNLVLDLENRVCAKIHSKIQQEFLLKRRHKVTFKDFLLGQGNILGRNTILLDLDKTIVQKT